MCSFALHRFQTSIYGREIELMNAMRMCPLASDYLWFLIKHDAEPYSDERAKSFENVSFVVDVVAVCQHGTNVRVQAIRA